MGTGGPTTTAGAKPGMLLGSESIRTGATDRTDWFMGRLGVGLVRVTPAEGARMAGGGGCTQVGPAEVAEGTPAADTGGSGGGLGGAVGSAGEASATRPPQTTVACHK